jgi:cation diffusion facilitator CzcD-associated flavoprotein CzcO
MADLLLPFNSPASTSRKRLAGPIHAERHVKIICIGAGASGLLMAYKLQRHFQNFDLRIYEKNVDISGTWFENRYPGFVCRMSILSSH